MYLQIQVKLPTRSISLVATNQGMAACDLGTRLVTSLISLVDKVLEQG